MRTTILGGLAITLVLGLTGCGSIEGTWQMHQVTPSTMAGEFDYGTVTLASDGTYTATTQTSQGTQTINGSYTYDSKTKTLTLHSDTGRMTTYEAEVTDMNKTLEVEGVKNGVEWTARMMRQ